MLYRSPASLSHKNNKAIRTLCLHFSICGPFTGDDSNPSVKEKLLLINGLSVVLLPVLGTDSFSECWVKKCCMLYYKCRSNTKSE